MTHSGDVQPMDVRERGRDAAGHPIYANRRLFMQLLAFTGTPDRTRLCDALATSSVNGALYADLNDPCGVALVVAHEDPGFFAAELRDFLAHSPFFDLSFRPAFTMFGRTYAVGYEPDLDQVLVNKPLARLCDPANAWAIWYPLRRTGDFERLDASEKQAIMAEHGHIGARFSMGGHGQDIRLACHGLDQNDNDFVIGLVGPELAPLSLMVQAMRRTRQTASYIERLGPFLIGKVLWQRTPKDMHHAS